MSDRSPTPGWLSRRDGPTGQSSPARRSACLDHGLGSAATLAGVLRGCLHDAWSVTVVPDSAVARAAAVRSRPTCPGPGGAARSWSPQPSASRSPIVFLVLAVRGTDLSAVWRTLAASSLPLLGAVACMGVVYWLQAARWRRIADTALGQRRFVEMVVAGVAVNNVLPGRVGDLLRARWVSRGAYSGGRGLATVMLDRVFDLLALVAFLLISLPLSPTRAGSTASSSARSWCSRVLGAIVAARAYTRRRPRARRRHRGLRRRFLRDTIEGLSDPLGTSRRRAARPERRGVARLGGRGHPRRPGRGRGAHPRGGDLRDRGDQPRCGDPVVARFVGTYQWLGVSALALFGFGREAGLAFAIIMQAVWWVPTTLVGAVLLVAHAKGAWRTAQIFAFGSPSSR